MNPLTERQTELLGWVASGLTIGQAATKCYITTQSAYNILSTARNRAGVSTVTQLAVIAVRDGWLEQDDQGTYVPRSPARSV